MFRVENLYPHYKEAIKVEWNIGKRCNYDCSYCPAEIHDNISSHQDINKMKTVIDTLCEIKNKKIRISFTGGEPCVHPQFTQLLEYAKPKVSWINVTTNGTRTAEYYQHLLSDLVNHLVLSLHFEFDWQKALNSILRAYKGSNNKNVLVHVMMLPGRLKDVSDACRHLKEVGIRYALRPIRWTESHDHFVDMEKYSKAERKFLTTENHTPPKNTLIDETVKCNVNDLLINKTNQFKDWKCNAGLESLMINWDGEVHRATCRVGGSLGNIYQGTFSQPTEAIDCTREWCTCAADINITKIKV
jgi:MoaA/NifB/PqqE/SkfB family radical SAM enzyme